MAKKYDYDVILGLPMGDNDADAKTIREYLLKILLNVWDEGEGFSGKRPFGNSGWEYELYRPLVQYKIIEGTIDEDGYLGDFDDFTGAKVIHNAIKHMCKLPGSPKN